MVRSAVTLFAGRGMSATSFSDVLADSGAPRGSIYHHFPGGKQQLTIDAVRFTAERVLTYLRAGPAASPRAELERFVSLWREVVVASSATSGCAVAGVALDTTDDAPLLAVVAEVFRSWVEALAAQLVAAGLATERAAPVAETTLAAMEGALILCRAEGSARPLDTVAAELVRLLGD